MASARDLTGQRFGALVAKRPNEERRNGSIMWECQCDCGNIINVRSGHLTGGHTRSCGCLRREKGRSQYKDLRGQRFGRLVALQPTEARRKRKIVWECQCDCGNITFVSSGNLISGATQSCGCLKRVKIRRHHNDLTGQQFGKLVALRPMEESKNGHVVWECRCDCGNFVYVRSSHLVGGHTRSCGCRKGKNSTEKVPTLSEHETMQEE